MKTKHVRPSRRYHRVFSRSRAAIVLGLAAFSTACETVDVAPIDAADDKSAVLEKDEAGLWFQMNQVEKAVRSSGYLEKDPSLNAYINRIVCDLAGDEFCGSVRVYIVKAPYFNASMAPNGMMQVYTGLLLRAQNEAEAAFVLGHEIAHYRQRHSLEGWRDLKNTANSALFLGLALGAAGAGQLSGILGNVALYGRLFGFNRDREREADDLGFDYAVAAGYDGGASATLWQGLIDEVAASRSNRKKKKFATAGIFTTHPVSSERVATLKAKAVDNPGGDLFTGRYQKETGRFLGRWLDDDLVRRDFGENIFLIERLMQRGTHLGLLHYRRGEAYRLRNGENDINKAITEYKTAITHSDTPAEAWRELGTLLRKKGNTVAAREAFAGYLRRAPTAHDRKLIEQYIK